MDTKPNLVLTGPAHPAAVQEAPRAHDIVGTNLYPQQEVIQLFSRSPLAIAATETVLPWTVVEGLFLSILQMRLQARGLVVGLREDHPARA